MVASGAKCMCAVRLGRGCNAGVQGDPRWQPREDTDGHSAACTAATGYGVRREAKRHAAFGTPRPHVKRCRRCALPPQSKTPLSIRGVAGLYHTFCGPAEGSPAVSPLRTAGCARSNEGSRRKPPNATSKPPQSLLIANRLRPQSHPKAISKRQQSANKATPKPQGRTVRKAAFGNHFSRVE